MKYIRIICCFIILIKPISGLNAASISDPGLIKPAYKMIYDFPLLKIKEAERLTGIKLNLVQRIKYSLLKNKLNKLSRGGQITPVQSKKATWSLILGIGCIALGFIPVIGVLSIPAAILAIIFGIQSLKGNSNTKGLIGIILGSLFLIVFSLVLLAFLG